MIKILSLLLTIVMAVSAHGQDNSSTVNLIPKPVELKIKTGSFTIDQDTKLVVKDEGDRPSAEFFNEYLKNYYGLSLDITDAAKSNCIVFHTRPNMKIANSEKYTLNGTAREYTLEGQSYAGTFRGVQTLIQLLPVGQNGPLQVPLVQVSDQPRFAYRGLLLDVGRHFFPPEFIKKYIDYIALHKMNYFHWHLTDDQGWRIEIKKYPELTRVGAYRNGTIIGKYPGKENDHIRYGGFYTQEEIKDIVAYAAKRYITVIPEIEMPGHSLAALASYPELGCTGGPYEVKQTWGVEDDVYCAGNDQVFTFLENVLDEVMQLFPSEYIHIGGDECPKKRWQACPKCQKRIKDNNLKDEHGLQSYFVQRIEKYLNGKGRKIIGWDEILEGGLAPNATVMSWRGEKGGIEAAQMGHQVIMTPGSHVYLDHAQIQNEDSVVIGGYTSLEKVYGYEPVPAQLTGEATKKVLGAQGNVWTEYMDNTSKVEYMVFPRATALSEVLWSPATSRNWNDFQNRMKAQYKRYDLWKTNYYKKAAE